MRKEDSNPVKLNLAESDIVLPIIVASCRRPHQTPRTQSYSLQFPESVFLGAEQFCVKDISSQRRGFVQSAKTKRQPGRRDDSFLSLRCIKNFKSDATFGLSQNNGTYCVVGR